MFKVYGGIILQLIRKFQIYFPNDKEESEH